MNDRDADEIAELREQVSNLREDQEYSEGRYGELQDQMHDLEAQREEAHENALALVEHLLTLWNDGQSEELLDSIKGTLTLVRNYAVRNVLSCPYSGDEFRLKPRPTNATRLAAITLLGEYRSRLRGLHGETGGLDTLNNWLIERIDEFPTKHGDDLEAFYEKKKRALDLIKERNDLAARLAAIDAELAGGGVMTEPLCVEGGVMTEPLCVECDGRKIVVCKECHGLGVDERDVKCWYCEGDAEYECGTCGEPPKTDEGES